jgi:choline dehydrogenase-like flavoprotein
MDMYATNQNGPFASGGNIAGGFLPVMDFMSPGVKSELSVEGQVIVKGLLKSQTDNGKPFTEEHTAFVGSLLNTPTEGSGGFFSYPAQGNFIPKIGSNDIIGSSEPGKFFTICCMLLHPLSRGSSHITSSSPDAKPVIDPRYLSNPLDLEILARHVRYISKIASAEPLSQLLKPNGRKNYGTPTDMSSLAEVKEYVKKAVLSCWHPTSTCAMLPLDKGGVVDSTLLVYGTKNLRIVDASVFPLSSRGNCQSTVYAVAEKAADLIKGEYTS